MHIIQLREYKLNMHWLKTDGHLAKDASRSGGVYAEIHWPTNSLRIGHAKEFRGRHMGHVNWAGKHKNGTHPPALAKRKGEIVDIAKKWGKEGWRYYVICEHPNLQPTPENFENKDAGKSEREAVENFLHHWAREINHGFYNINRESAQNRLMERWDKDWQSYFACQCRSG